jgi:probable F420-dependent oxidoreductase
MRRLRIGVQIAQYGTPWAALRSAAIEAESMGVDAVFNWDHFFGPGTESEGAHLECWTMLAAWAEATERITIGPLVSAIGYRNPDLLANMAQTVDLISRGRLVLGLGAGFKQRDYEEYGYDFLPIGRRLNALDEGVGRIRSRLAQLNPGASTALPILIGGSGEQRTLRIVARSADIWHTFADGEDFEHKSRLLDRYCADLGRNPYDIERSVLVAGDPAATGDHLRNAGASLLIVRVDGRPRIDLRPVQAWLRWRDASNARAEPG